MVLFTKECILSMFLFFIGMYFIFIYKFVL